MTWSIVGACTLFFIWEKLINPDGFDARVLDFAIVPAFISGNFEPAAAMPLPPWATLVTSLFLHVDTLHLAVNMLYLWVFGDNIEDAMGHAKFVVFYLLCGVIAGLVHVWLDPSSMAPTLGARCARARRRAPGPCPVPREQSRAAATAAPRRSLGRDAGETRWPPEQYTGYKWYHMIGGCMETKRASRTSPLVIIR